MRLLESKFQNILSNIDVLNNDVTYDVIKFAKIAREQACGLGLMAHNNLKIKRDLPVS